MHICIYAYMLYVLYGYIISRIIHIYEPICDILMLITSSNILLIRTSARRACSWRSPRASTAFGNFKDTVFNFVQTVFRFFDAFMVQRIGAP